jgi:hypothetical protein
LLWELDTANYTAIRFHNPHSSWSCTPQPTGTITLHSVGVACFFMGVHVNELPLIGKLPIIGDVERPNVAWASRISDIQSFFVRGEGEAIRTDKSIGNQSQ